MTRTGAATHNSRAKVFEVHAVDARLAYGIAFYTAALWTLDISASARRQIATYMASVYVGGVKESAIKSVG
jgi:hypothetical protein